MVDAVNRVCVSTRVQIVAVREFVNRICMATASLVEGSCRDEGSYKKSHGPLSVMADMSGVWW